MFYPSGGRNFPAGGYADDVPCSEGGSGVRDEVGLEDAEVLYKEGGGLVDVRY